MQEARTSNVGSATPVLPKTIPMGESGFLERRSLDDYVKEFLSRDNYSLAGSRVRLIKAALLLHVTWENRFTNPLKSRFSQL